MDTLHLIFLTSFKNSYYFILFLKSYTVSPQHKHFFYLFLFCLLHNGI